MIPESGVPERHGGVRSTAAVREGVRLGIRDALAGEVDRTSASTAVRLAGAGLLGLVSGSAAVALFSRGAPAEVDRLHLAVCAAAWSSVLVIGFAFVLLRIGSRRLPLAQSAAFGLVGLGLASLAGFACPHPHMLEWWVHTPVGTLAEARLGVDASTLCLGLCLALIASGGASLLVMLRGIPLPRVHLSALLLFVMIWPAVAVQALGTSPVTLASWTVGLAVGSWIGIATMRTLAVVAIRVVRMPVR